MIVTVSKSSRLKNSKSILLSSILLAIFVDIKILNSIIIAAIPSLSGVMTALYTVVIGLLFIVGLLFQHHTLRLNYLQTIIISTCCTYYLITYIFIGEPSVKISFFLTFTIAAFLLPSIVKYDARLVLRSIFIIPSFGVLYSQYLFLDEISKNGFITMGLSYALLVPVIAAVIYLIYYFIEDKFWVKIILLPFICCNMFYLFQMLAFGSRGPVLSIFVAIVFCIVIKVRQNKKVKIRYSRLLLISVLGVIIAFSFIPIMEILSSKLAENGLQFNFVEKMIRLASAGDVSNGRNKLTDITLSGIYDEPILGHGTAQFENNTGLVYPHNFLLQMLYDGGIVLTLLIMLPVLLKIRSKFRRMTKEEFVWIYFLLFSSVPGAFFSGDLWNANLLWMLFGTILTETRLKSRMNLPTNYG